MITKFLAAFVLLLGLSTVPLPGNAMVFTNNPADKLGPLNGGTVSYTVTTPGASSSPGNATLTFDLIGYDSVDGANSFKDTFKLSVNGTLLFQGGFDMGGGGTSFVDFANPGVTVLSTVSNGFFAGGLTQLSIAHTLLSGSNTYLFDYGTMQGLGDEGWGLRNLRISADIAPVPLPGALILFGAGLAGLGFLKRKSWR